MRLNLGCGPKPLDGYVNIDVEDGPGVDLVADVTDRALPGLVAARFGGEPIDEIRLDAAYEHIWEKDRERCLRMWLCMLQPGGQIAINWVPDFAAVVEQFSDRTQAGPNPDALREARKFVFGEMNHLSDPMPQIHKDLFTPENLSAELVSAGFSDVVVERAKYGCEGTAMNLCARARRS